MGVVAITFDSYLSKLKSLESAKHPSERREVPSIRQIALSAGLKGTTANRLMGGHVTAISLKKLARILDDMRARGFNTQLTDFLTYMPDQQLSSL